ncbi:MAG: L,D-transpeptidase family protein [Alphaproteobacteria bacterium]|nr:L,D-transpeptidase family protein [Alphaproteobacteria bacterium]
MRFLKRFFLLLTVIFLFAVFDDCFSQNKATSQTKTPLLTADTILIKKNQRKMELYNKGKLIKGYKISIGFAPIGTKQQEGDGKTPEGEYTITSKNPHSQFHKSLKISYPNTADKENAKKKKVSPGGDIMIHGLGKQFSYLGKLHTLHDWTFGCIAVTNEEIDEIWKLVKEGTIVKIEP